MANRVPIPIPNPNALNKWWYKKPGFDSTAFWDLQGYLGVLIEQLVYTSQCLAQCCEALNRIQPLVDSEEADLKRLNQGFSDLCYKVKELSDLGGDMAAKFMAIKARVDTRESELKKLTQELLEFGTKIKDLRDLIDSKVADLGAKYEDQKKQLMIVSESMKILESFSRSFVVHWLPWILIPVAWLIGVICSWLIFRHG